MILFHTPASRLIAPSRLGERVENRLQTYAVVPRENDEINPMPHLDNETLLLAFVAVTGLAVLLQALILLAIFLTVRKAASSVREQAEDMRSAVMPIVYNTRELMTRLAPKIEGTVDDLADIARGLKAQSAEMQSTVDEITGVMRRQTNRIDDKVTNVLNGVDKIGSFVAEVVSRPVRQVSGLLASIKAIVEALRAPAPEPRGTRSSWDKDMFV